MRAPFREASEVILASKYRCERDASTGHIVFGGDFVVLEFSGAGTYYNRGRHYVSASLRLRMRFRPFDIASAGRRALEKVKLEQPDLIAAVTEVPRSDKQAIQILATARKIDESVARHVPEMEILIAAEEAEKTRISEQEQAGRRKQAIEEDVKEAMFAEVMRLDEEGLLDGSNALSVLKALADRIRSANNT